MNKEKDEFSNIVLLIKELIYIGLKEEANIHTWPWRCKLMPFIGLVLN